MGSTAPAVSLAGSAVIGGQRRAPTGNMNMWFMPDESHRHRRTWMAFGAHEGVWGDLLPFVRANLALVANAIVKHEPVSMLVRPQEQKIAAGMCDERIKFVLASLDDLWIRDTGPTFVLNAAGELGAVDLNFNGWGAKQQCDNDAKVARLVGQSTGAEYRKAELVGEGGGIEVDGHGTAIVTESCFINANRNPNTGKEECESILKELFGIRKVIWLPGVRGQDITDGHTDFYARFARPGVVLAGLETDRQSFDYEITREHIAILKSARDADGRKLNVIPLRSPRQIRPEFDTEDFAAGYINYYVTNGAVIAPEFGDEKSDSNCRDVLRRMFPGRNIVQLNVDAIAAGGGGIHCVTQQEPHSSFSSSR